MNLQFGMPTLIENRTLEDNIALCTELGLNFIELNMNFPEYQIDKLENTSYFAEAARKAGIYFSESCVVKAPSNVAGKGCLFTPKMEGK